MRLGLTLLLLATAATGCAAPVGRGLADERASVKIPAIKQAVTSNDKAAAPQLVADLDDDDPAIRLYAIEGLRRLTGGQTMGYRHFDDVPQRRKSIERWQAWLADQGEAGR